MGANVDLIIIIFFLYYCPKNMLNFNSIYIIYFLTFIINSFNFNLKLKKKVLSWQSSPWHRKFSEYNFPIWITGKTIYNAIKLNNGAWQQDTTRIVVRFWSPLFFQKFYKALKIRGEITHSLLCTILHLTFYWIYTQKHTEVPCI